MAYRGGADTRSASGGGTRRRGRGEAGLSLLEMVLAITLAGALFASLAGVLTNMMIASLFARQNQNAIDLISQRIEVYRAGSYTALAHDPTDVPGSDPAITKDASGTWVFDPGAGTGPEPIALLTKGIKPHRAVVVKGRTTYTVSTYVTQPTDAAGSYKRVTVRASWFKGAARHERQATTFVALQRRGLPLPNFTFGLPIEVTFGSGTKVVLPVTIVNRGARDAWNLTATADRSWAFTWYRDGDNDGVLDDPTVDPLADSDGDGTFDTGLLDTDQQLRLFAVTQLASSEPATAIGFPVNVTLTAASRAQPQAAGTKSFVDKVNVTTGCVGCTYRRYFLHNSLTETGDTLAQADMPLDGTAPSSTTLANFDTDHDSAPGRLVGASTADPDEADLALMANWVHQVPNETTLSSSSPVRVRVSAASVGGEVKVHLRRRASGSSTFTLLATGSAPVVDGSAFQIVEVEVPLSVAVVLGKDDALEVKVEATGAGALLAYDTTTYPSHVLLPVVAGG